MGGGGGVTEPTRYNVTGEIAITRQYTRYVVAYTVLGDHDVLADDKDAAADAILRHYMRHGVTRCEWVGTPEVRERE